MKCRYTVVQWHLMSSCSRSEEVKQEFELYFIANKEITCPRFVHSPDFLEINIYQSSLYVERGNFLPCSADTADFGECLPSKCSASCEEHGKIYTC